MFLSDISIKRPVFATMMMVALVVLGVVSYRRLAIDEYPDITYPVVIAQTTYPGASPDVMMRDVSKPIEEALNTVQGIKEITSTSLEGVSIVRLEFNLGVDVNVAPVQLGATDDRLGLVQVTDGLEAGDRVVVGNVGALGRGMQVTVAGQEPGISSTR